jgi:hypothetical protein
MCIYGARSLQYRIFYRQAITNFARIVSQCIYSLFYKTKHHPHDLHVYISASPSGYPLGVKSHLHSHRPALQHCRSRECYTTAIHRRRKRVSNGLYTPHSAPIQCAAYFFESTLFTPVHPTSGARSPRPAFDNPHAV